MGCLYRFDVRVFWADESEAVISMHQDRHVNDPTAQQPCHGPDSTPDNVRLLHAPRLSPAVKEYVHGLLRQNRKMSIRDVVLGE